MPFNAKMDTLLLLILFEPFHMYFCFDISRPSQNL